MIIDIPHTKNYIVWSWSGQWLPVYKHYKDYNFHESRFMHKQIHWLWLNILWDYRDNRSKS